MGVSLQKDAFTILEGRARRIGREHGRNAATWVFDGNTSRETYERFARWIADGDPELWDHMPRDGMSGEWADSYGRRELAKDLEVPPQRDGLDEWCDAYSEAFGFAAMREVERAVLEALSE